LLYPLSYGGGCAGALIGLSGRGGKLGSHGATAPPGESRDGKVRGNLLVFAQLGGIIAFTRTGDERGAGGRQAPLRGMESRRDAFCAMASAVANSSYVFSSRSVERQASPQ
jgi:hypothetical protein